MKSWKVWLIGVGCFVGGVVVGLVAVYLVCVYAMLDMWR